MSSALFEAINRTLLLQWAGASERSAQQADTAISLLGTEKEQASHRSELWRVSHPDDATPKSRSKPRKGRSRSKPVDVLGILTRQIEHSKIETKRMDKDLQHARGETNRRRIDSLPITRSDSDVVEYLVYRSDTFEYEVQGVSQLPMTWDAQSQVGSIELPNGLCTAKLKTDLDINPFHERSYVVTTHHVCGQLHIFSNGAVYGQFVESQPNLDVDRFDQVSSNLQEVLPLLVAAAFAPIT